MQKAICPICDGNGGLLDKPLAYDGPNVTEMPNIYIFLFKCSAFKPPKGFFF